MIIPRRWHALWHEHNGWIALLVILVGVFCFGYGLGLNQKQDRLIAAYTLVVSAKDQMINQLAKTTVRAAGQAAEANSAVDAMNCSTSAADQAASEAKAAADQAKVAADQAKAAAARRGKPNEHP